MRYRTEIRLSMKRTEKLGNGQFDWYDPGVAYDNRVCFLDFLLPEDQQKALQDFLSDSDLGRGNTFQLKVPKGIYPFGPDYGDNRRYVVRALNHDFSGSLNSPYQLFKTNIELLLISAPPNVIPDVTSKTGNFQIGSVLDLHFPESGFQPITEYKVNTAVLRGTGAALNAVEGDAYQSSFTLREQHSQAARLINYLQRTGRGGDITLTTTRGYWPFGRDKNGGYPGAGTFTCGLLDNIITVSHIVHNQWEINLQVFFKS